MKTLHKAARPGFLVFAALAAAIIAAPASAQSCKAPPGMSAIDQYCEAIPAAAGDRGSTDADRGGRPIPAATVRALERRGPDGQAIIGLSAASSKPGSKARNASPGGSSATAAPGTVRPAEHASDNPIAALKAGFADSGDTVGPLFGTTLLVFALVFFSTAWLRYRRRPQS
jgi:hypothetical protein